MRGLKELHFVFCFAFLGLFKKKQNNKKNLPNKTNTVKTPTMTIHTQNQCPTNVMTLYACNETGKSW